MKYIILDIQYLLCKNICSQNKKLAVHSTRAAKQNLQTDLIFWCLILNSLENVILWNNYLKIFLSLIESWVFYWEIHFNMYHNILANLQFLINVKDFNYSCGRNWFYRQSNGQNLHYHIQGKQNQISKKLSSQNVYLIFSITFFMCYL